MLSAGGAKFAGDFLVANLSDDKTQLEMVLVDVCGKGVGAGTQSLQFAGALGGLIGSLPPLGLFSAANDFLLRQHWDEGFATAVHVLVHLDTGEYSIINAGHPPAHAVGRSPEPVAGRRCSRHGPRRARASGLPPQHRRDRAGRRA